MKRKITKLAGVALIFGFALTVIFTVSAFSGKKEKRNMERFNPRLLYAQDSQLMQILRADNRGDAAWLLKPEVFNLLSAGGQRGALFKNGIIPPEGRVRPSRRVRTGKVTALLAPGDNVRANDPRVDDLFHTQSESSIAVNNSNIIVSFNDFGGITTGSVSGYAFSTDAGTTFTHKRIPRVSGLRNDGDGVVAFGPNGEVYYAELLALSAGTRNEKSTIGVSKSVDNGNTFNLPVDAGTTAANVNDFQDKEWITVDTTSSPFRGNVYVSWTSFSRGLALINVARSTNGGTTFDPPVTVSSRNGAASGSMPVVGPNGEIYVAFFNFVSSTVDIVKSVDGAKTFTQPKVTASLTGIGRDMNASGRAVLTGGNAIRVTSFPSIAVGKDGSVHIVYPGVVGLDRSDIFYVRSTDGGSNFSPSRKLNDDNSATSQFLPSVAVATDGTVGVKWWDRRNDPINDSLTDVYMTTSNDGGATFSKNFRITDTNWTLGPSEGGEYHGDYDVVTANGSNFFLCWSDERGTDPDIYVAQVPVNRNPNSPDFNISAVKLFDSVVAGNSVDFDFSISGTNGFSGGLSLSASTISGLSYKFATDTVAAGQPAKLTVSTSSSIEPGTYLISVSATGPGFTRKTNFRLAIFDPKRFAGLPVNASNTPGFTNPESGISFDLPVNSNMQVDAKGTVHVAFEDDSANINREIFYTQSVDGGKTYSKPIKVSNAGNSSRSKLTLDSSGNVYIVWTSQKSNGQAGNQIFLSKSMDGGKTFSTPAGVTPLSQSGSRASIVVSKSGTIMVTYSDFTNSTTRPLFAVRSINGGSSFSDPVPISSSNEIVVTNYAAFDSKGAAYAVYCNLGDLDAATVRFAIAADGKTFSAPKVISNLQTAPAVSPHLAIDNNDNIFVAFSNLLEDSNSINFEVILIKSSDRGNTFSSQMNISNNDGFSLSPFIIPDNKGNVNVVWQDEVSVGDTAIIAAGSDDNSGRGGEEEEGRDPDNANEDIVIARSTDGGQTFSKPGNLSANSGISFGASGSVDADGNLFVAWTDDSSANDDIFVAPLLFFKPQPPVISNFDPTSGAVGSEIRIFGTSFKGATSVIFSGNVAVQPANFTVSDDGIQITTKVPQGAQTGPISVVTPLGTAVSSGTFTIISSDFSVQVSPASQTLLRGMSTSFTVGLQAVGNFNAQATLTATVTPSTSALTTSFSQSTITAGGSSTLTVNATSAADAGTFNILVTATAGQLVRTRTVTVNVVSPDFSLVFNPAQLTAARGQKGKITAMINRTGGFTGNVTVTAPDTKAIKVKLTPPQQSTTGASVSFDFKIKPKANTGSQQLVFTGRDDSGRVRTGTLTLLIQ